MFSVSTVESKFLFQICLCKSIEILFEVKSIFVRKSYVMYRPVIPHSARRFYNENRNMEVIYKKMNIESNRSNYGSFKAKSQTEESKISIIRIHQSQADENSIRYNLQTLSRRTRSMSGQNQANENRQKSTHSSSISTFYTSDNKSQSDYHSEIQSTGLSSRDQMYSTNQNNAKSENDSVIDTGQDRNRETDDN